MRQHNNWKYRAVMWYLGGGEGAVDKERRQEMKQHLTVGTRQYLPAVVYF